MNKRLIIGFVLILLVIFILLLLNGLNLIKLESMVMGVFVVYLIFWGILK